MSKRDACSKRTINKRDVYKIAAKPDLRKKSSMPKKMATPMLIATTIMEYCTTCCCVGQVTFFNSRIDSWI